MNANIDPEAVLTAWLDEGPTELPDATRRAILTSLSTTPQARRGLLAAIDLTSALRDRLTCLENARQVEASDLSSLVRGGR